MEDCKTIYREYIKKNDKFIAQNKFYISEDIEGKNILYDFDLDRLKINNDEKIIPYSNNCYLFLNDLNKNYIQLILISSISFSIDDTNINKNEIIKKYIDNDTLIDDSFINDLYFNEKYSNHINITIPDKYKVKNDNNKYLFKIDYNMKKNEEVSKEYIF
jgi:hypothetical protein